MGAAPDLLRTWHRPEPGSSLSCLNLYICVPCTVRTECDDVIASRISGCGECNQSPARQLEGHVVYFRYSHQCIRYVSILDAQARSHFSWLEYTNCKNCRLRSAYCLLPTVYSPLPWSLAPVIAGRTSQDRSLRSVAFCRPRRRLRLTPRGLPGLGNHSPDQSRAKPPFLLLQRPHLLVCSKTWQDTVSSDIPRQYWRRQSAMTCESG